MLVSLQVKLVTKHLQPLHDELQKSLSQALWQRRIDPSARYPLVDQVSHPLQVHVWEHRKLWGLSAVYMGDGAICQCSAWTEHPMPCHRGRLRQQVRPQTLLP